MRWLVALSLSLIFGKPSAYPERKSVTSHSEIHWIGFIVSLESLPELNLEAQKRFNFEISGDQFSAYQKYLADLKAQYESEKKSYRLTSYERHQSGDSSGRFQIPGAEITAVIFKDALRKEMLFHEPEVFNAKINNQPLTNEQMKFLSQIEDLKNDKGDDYQELLRLTNSKLIEIPSERVRSEKDLPDFYLDLLDVIANKNDLLFSINSKPIHGPAPDMGNRHVSWQSGKNSEIRNINDAEKFFESRMIDLIKASSCSTAEIELGFIDILSTHWGYKNIPLAYLKQKLKCLGEITFAQQATNPSD